MFQMGKKGMTKTDNAQGSVLILAPVDHQIREHAAAWRNAGIEVIEVTSAAEATAVAAERMPSVAVVHDSSAQPSRLGDLASVRVLLEDGAPIDASARSHFDFELAIGPLVEQLPGLVRVGQRLAVTQDTCRRLALDLNAGGREFSGCSAATRRVNTALRRAADSDATILVEGKAGTGKSMAALWIHQGSRRCNRAPVVVEASGLDPERLEAALAEAASTTLVLEGVEMLPAKSQSMLVRHLKERHGAVAGQARVVATTAARLPEMVARGQFREDLFYRLNMFPVVLPTLRERREDIAILAKDFAGVGPSGECAFTPAAMILLESHPWEGNVAQLRNVVERAVSLAGGGAVDRMHLLGPATGLSANFDHPLEQHHREPADNEDDDDLREEDIRPLQEEEERLLGRALKATQGNVRRAAQLLGIGRATLYRKIQVYDLKLT